MLELKAVRMDFPADANIIVGQSHFIKTVEDLYEAIVTTVPQAKFGIAFNESSGACLTRSEGNEQALRDAAIRKCPGIGLRPHLPSDPPKRLPHQRSGRDTQRAGGVLDLLCDRQLSRNHCRSE
jgi:hypothetical protein